MEAGRREETGKLEEESGSRRSMLMVRQFVVVMLWGRWREIGFGGGLKVVRLTDLVRGEGRISGTGEMYWSWFVSLVCKVTDMDLRKDLLGCLRPFGSPYGPLPLWEV